MIGWQAKAIIAGLALAGLVAFGLHYRHLRNRADQADIAERALTDYRAAVAQRDKLAAEDQAAAQSRTKALSDAIDLVNESLAALRANPPKQAVRYVDPEGQPTPRVDDCPRLRLDPEWVRAYNAAADASVPHTD